ncbi:MAG: biotin/lipoyl-containing protein, partial [Methylophilaceae bacterium]
MSQLVEILVPDIGNFDSVDVIEVLVKPGDSVAKEDPLITLESDKASMDIPAPEAGTVKQVKLKVGDKVQQGSLILTLEKAVESAAEPAKAEPVPTPASAPAPAPSAATSAPANTA